MMRKFYNDFYLTLFNDKINFSNQFHYQYQPINFLSSSGLFINGIFLLERFCRLFFTGGNINISELNNTISKNKISKKLILFHLLKQYT